jgi:DNA-binding protein YbaB
MLQDLVVTAVRDALKKAQDHHSQKMGQITGGLKIPGLF